jgi:hypothetical protein
LIGQVLVFVRKQLDAFLRAELGDDPHDPSADKVVFLDGEKLDPMVFQTGAVSQLLINLEEDRVLRGADPYRRKADDGKPQQVMPEIRLGLYVLFVARFTQYDRAWDHLTKVIEFLQAHRTFERAASAELPAGVDLLSVELVTQTFAEQNEVWNALRATYHPSVLYRLRLVIVRDQVPVGRDQITKPVVVNVRRIS